MAVAGRAPYKRRRPASSPHFAFDLYFHLHLGRDLAALSIVGIATILSDRSCLFAQMHECTICVDNHDRPFPSAVREYRGRFKLVRYSSIYFEAVHNLSRAMFLTERSLTFRMYATTQAKSPQHTPSGSI